MYLQELFTVDLITRMKNLFPRVSDILEIDSLEAIIWLKSHSPNIGFSGVFTQRKKNYFKAG